MVLAEARPVAPLYHVKNAWVPDDLRFRLKAYSPRTELGGIVRECFKHLPAELAAALLDQITRIVVLESSLSVRIFRTPDSLFWNGQYVEDIGEVSRKVITDAGVGFLVDAWQNSVELEAMKYHGIGTGTTAEAAGQTALVTETTTGLNPDNTRATGTTTASAANIFQTVATNTVDATVAAEEHGLFNQAATGGGTMWDRSLTGTQSLSSGDSLQTTYNMTATSGG